MMMSDFRPRAQTKKGPRFFNRKPFLEMVDQSEVSTHTPALVEIIEFQGITKVLDHDQMASLYAESVLSTSQIAKRLGCSRSIVVTTLKRRGILRTKGPGYSAH
jgi:hypothetical protein